MSVPTIRVTARNGSPVHPERRYVLYWMIGSRRTRFNFGLERAVDAAALLGKPLVVLEGLRIAYPWASDRLHRFVLDGMADNARRFAAARISYIPYVEPAHAAGRGLLEALGRDACLVVTDDSPAFLLPRLVEAASRALDVRTEAVDGNGLLPIQDADRAFPTAYAFRRHLQRSLPAHLAAFPEPDPLARKDLPRGAPVRPEIAARWPSASALEELPLDHRVAPVPDLRGGEEAGRARLTAFVSERLARYGEDRNEPDADGASGLSPYLHFGHVSIHEVVLAVAAREGWTPGSVAKTAGGSRTGWWGMGAAAESFLDQAVTWRELGFNAAARGGGDDRFESLPDWARRTLAEHASDPRPHVYELDAFDEARTHDPLWNAAQTQLVRDGTIHNYLRMLWGKKILEWSPSPEDALHTMIELNNRYALDGRDPNSTSGIFWVLGRYDRPWGPERPIFGVVRYMSSENTARKMSVKAYLRRFQ
jgi:deoxyribodipyrimidine photo-lyase